MVDGVNNSNTVNWLTLLSTQKKHSAGSARNAGSTADGQDSAEISGQSYGSGRAGERKDPLEQLVNDGTITDEQASAIGQVLHSAIQSGQMGSGTDPLAGLVSAGTITQDQADSVKNVFEASRPAQGRKDFMSGIMENLVSDGTLTQDQADTVKQALM